jgi:hypothetical protein
MQNVDADTGIRLRRVVFGQVEPAPSRMSSSGGVIAPIVVMSHTTTVVASQDAMPSIVSPRASIDARIKATIDNAKPVPPRSSGTYQWGNFKIDNDRIACVTANTTTATINPGTDNATPGTIPAATSSPIAHDARSTTARTKIRLAGLMGKGIRWRALLHSLPPGLRLEWKSSDAAAARMPPAIRSLITGGSSSVLCYAQNRLSRDAFVGGECGGGFGEGQHSTDHGVEASIPYSRGEVGESGPIGLDNEVN